MLAIAIVLSVVGITVQVGHCSSRNQSEVIIPVEAKCTNYTSFEVGSGDDLAPLRQCWEIDDALEMLASDITLMLQPGTHLLNRNHDTITASGLQNVSIIGVSSDTVVTCAKNVGFTFMNVSGLIISNITVVRCGASQVNATSLPSLNTTRIHPILKAAVFLSNCSDVQLYKVSIINTTGLGLLGINIRGTSSFSNVNFTNNSPVSCSNEETTYEQIGGGVHFIYYDEQYFTNDSTKDNTLSHRNETRPEHHLVLSDSHFKNNTDCSNAAVVYLSYIHDEQFYAPVKSHQIGGGGGLSVFLAQKSFYMKVKVESSTFEGNTAIVGGGALVGIFSGVRESIVDFNQCIFENNGFTLSSASESAESPCLQGAGLAILTDLPLLQPGHPTGLHYQEDHQSYSVKIQQTCFINNEAKYTGGGIFAISLDSEYPPPLMESPITQFILRDCLFDNNKARYGAAGHFYKKNRDTRKDLTSLHLDNITVIRCASVDPKDITQAHTITSSSLDFVNMMVAISNQLNCINNSVTGLALRSAILTVTEHTNITFKYNIGHEGGAIYIEGELPLIKLQSHTAITFEANIATIKGGAIYISPLSQNKRKFQHLYYSRCFIIPPKIPNCSGHLCFNLSRQLSKVLFINNTAPLGEAIYGSTLQSCSWEPQLTTRRSNESIYQVLDRELKFMEFERSPDFSYSRVNTPPVRMTINATKTTVYPGEIIQIHARIYDGFDNLVPSVIRTIVLDDAISANTSFENNDITFALITYYDEIYLKVVGEEDQEFNVTFVEIMSQLNVNLTVRTLRCSVGFIFNPSKLTCECDHELMESGVKCYFQHGYTLSVPKSFWIGPLFQGNDTITTEDLIVRKCYSGYCKKGDQAVMPPDYDKQCVDHSYRTGVLCGKCLTGYSITLGHNTHCLKCTDKWLAWIVFFAFLGIGLFLAIAFLQITVDKGWVYVILFYSNTATLYSHLIESEYLHFFLLPAKLLSLQIGAPICLYDGMETLSHYGLQLVFPTYLYFLMVIFALLSQRWSCLSRRFSPTKTFLTLIVMSYTSILETCVAMTQCLPIHTLGGKRSVRWQPDPNVECFKGWHMTLAVIGYTLLLLYIIPMPLLMLCPTLAYKYIKKFKPFFDAMWAPFELKFRFWLGVRILALVVVYFVEVLEVINDTIKGPVLLCIILSLFLQVQSSIRPFKNKWINIMDGFLIVGNIILLLALTNKYSTKNNERDKIEKVLMLLSLGICYGLVLIALILSLIIRFPQLKNYNIHAKDYISICKIKVKQAFSFKRKKLTCDYDLNEMEDVNRCTGTSIRLHSVQWAASFRHYREALLDDD